jgi:uncharacterized protein YjbI with pentapeptide repeats
VVIALIIVGYWFDWTGFDGYNKVTIAHIISGTNAGTVTRTEEYQPGKALWDWLQLLIIPAVLAVGGYLFSFTTSRNERKAADLHNQTERAIAQDNQREAALKEYFEKMSELLLHENLRQSDPDDEVRKIARVWTLTVLQRLDEYRKGSLLQFVHESGLMDEGKSIIDLSGADLTNASLVALVLTNANLSRTTLIRANLMGAHLAGANLSGTTLWGANLTSADLTGANLIDASIGLRHYAGDEPIITRFYDANLTNANLSGARIYGADLRYANLRGADLTGADLTGALITEKQLDQAKSLKGATMPDGSIHP